MASEDTQRETEKCLDIAESAFRSGDRDKAMRLVKKAIRMNPNDRATSLLAAIEAGDTRAVNSTRPRNTAYGAYSNQSNSLEINKSEAENCLERAENAFHAGDLEKAEKLALKAGRMYPSTRAEDLLKQIQSDDNTRNARGSYNGRPTPNQYNHNSENLQANKSLEEAERCIEVAEEALNKGDLNKAEKFVNKAQRFHETTRGGDLLRQVLAAKERNGIPNGNPIGERPVKTPRVERRPRVPIPPRDEPSSHNEMRRQRPEYTEEQLEAIRRVQAAKDDYEILGVPKKSKFSAIKTAFRKLSKLLHPDRNKSSEAKESFIKITEAVERLKRNGA